MMVTIHLIGMHARFLLSTTPVTAVRGNSGYEKIFVLGKVILWLKINSGSLMIIAYRWFWAI